MANPYKTTDSYYPGAGYDNSVGKSRNSKKGYQPPSPDQEAPQRLGDSDNLRGPDYDQTVSLKGWLRGPDATQKPGFDRGKK